jgi:hypothetical protein
MGAEEREKGMEEVEAETEAEAEAGRGIALRVWLPPRSSRFGTSGVLAIAASVARRSCRLEGAEEIWWASITALRGRALECARELERERVAIVVSPRSQHTALYPRRHSRGESQLNGVLTNRPCDEEAVCKPLKQSFSRPPAFDYDER